MQQDHRLFNRNVFIYNRTNFFSYFYQFYSETIYISYLVELLAVPVVVVLRTRLSVIERIGIIIDVVVLAFDCSGRQKHRFGHDDLRKFRLNINIAHILAVTLSVIKTETDKYHSLVALPR